MKQPDRYDETTADPHYATVRQSILDGAYRPQISLVQRHTRCGYNLAARIIECLEYDCVITPMDRNGTREVL